MRIGLICLGLLMVVTGSIWAQQPPPPNTGALTNHRIQLATSQDGLDWRVNNDILRPSTSVPALVYWQESLWVLAVNGTDDENFEKLVMMHQLSDGTWEEWFIQLDFEGRPVDPDLMVLPDGNLRLYFFDLSAMAGGPPTPNQSRIGKMYSAVSSDGVIFTMEEDVRLESDPPATDPDVIQQKEDAWWMFVSQGQTMDIAFSTDGLNFAAVGEITHGAISDTVLLENGNLRQYACAQARGIVVAESSDGLNWAVLPNFKTPPGCDPDALQLPDGSWVMVYKTFDPPQ